MCRRVVRFPAAVEHRRRECPLTFEKRLRVGRLGHDPNLRETAFADNLRDLVEIGGVRGDKLEDGATRALKLAQDVGLVAAVEVVAGVLQLRRDVELVDEVHLQLPRERARRLDLDSPPAGLDLLEQRLKGSLLQQRLASADHDHGDTHPVELGQQFVDGLLGELDARVISGPIPREFRVTKLTGKIASPQPHESAEPAD